MDATGLYPNYTAGGFNDLGQAINAAIAMLPPSALSPHAGEVTIGPGIFYSSTTVIRPQQVTIRGSGNGTLIVFLPLTGLFAIDGDGIGSAGSGGWSDLRLQGPKNTTNPTATADAFFLGGDPKGIIAPAANMAPFSNYNNVEIGYFHTGVRIGNNVWDIGLTQCRIHDNVNGAAVEPYVTNVGEVLGFFNSQVYNNSSHALYAPGGRFPAIGWTAVGSAFDYNGDGIHPTIVGQMRSITCHFEQKHWPIWDGQHIDFGSSVVIVGT